MTNDHIESIKQDKRFLDALGIRDGAQIEFVFLGSGEYNRNYSFQHPDTKARLVLRIPMGSQMHLDHQAQYEYDALSLIQASKRTPKPLYVDPEKTIFPYGFLVIEHLPGRALNYKSDLTIAAPILADIHSVPIPDTHHFITPEKPLAAILEECNSMAAVYFEHTQADQEAKMLLSELLEKGKHLLDGTSRLSQKCDRCLINTELNSGNFLINGAHESNYLIDWEKPLFAFAEQDLGHFLAPTTTFWKTDVVLQKDEMLHFLSSYAQCSKKQNDAEALWEKTLPYFTMTCLRGISWCAMAWVDYQHTNRKNESNSAYEKIRQYISPPFLVNIRNHYIGV